MSKSRFTTTDTKAMVRDIRASLLGQRVANIYDLNEKSYLFKFAVPGVSEKVLLLMESGIRFHTTKYARDKSDMPSPFAMKLRKYIRTKRLEDVRQLSSDRVVDFKFGSGDSILHIILELYANGNIILTDGNFEVIALLRSHQFADDVAIKVGEIYPIAFATTLDSKVAAKPESAIISESTEDVVDAITSAALSVPVPVPVPSMDVATFRQWATTRDADSNAWQQASGNGAAVAASKKSKAKKMTMRQLLLSRDSGVSSNGPEILDHCLASAGVKASMKVAEFLALGDTNIWNVIQELRSVDALMSSLDVPGQAGYILFNEGISSSSPGELIPSPETSSTAAVAGTGTTVTTSGLAQEFVEFIPRIFKQHEGRKYQELASFDEAVDEYFCKLEEQKLQKQALSAEDAARKKIDKVRGEQESLKRSLEQQQRRMEEGAGLVELYADDVDKCTMVINSAINAGMSWDDIAEMVAVETAAGNPIASLVSRLRLERNIVVLKLKNLYKDDDDDENEDGGDDKNDDGEDGRSDDDDVYGEEVTELKSKSAKKKLKAGKKAKKDRGALAGGGKNKKSSNNNNFIEVEIDLNMTAHANACKMYANKKQAQAKEAKTVQAAERVLQSVESQAEKNLEAQKIKRNLQAVRKVHWFEKFNWFISSEGYLILSGRDAQQNEALVKRYLRPGDAYVHADVHGATSCIVRCKTLPPSVPGGSSTPKPISPFALQEAGTMTCCRSGAWNAKVVTSAWWVWNNQVSKTAPSGEYLSTGSFMIYGKKNYLPPMPLEMGFGIMFRLEDSSVARHAGERKDKSVMMDETESVLSEAASRYGIEFEGLGLRERDSDDDEDNSGNSSGSDDDEEEEEEGKEKRVVGTLEPIAESEDDEDDDGNDDGKVDEEKGGGRKEEHEHEEEEDDEGPENNNDDSRTKKGRNSTPTANTNSRISAKERKLMKKLKGKGEAADVATVRALLKTQEDHTSGAAPADGKEGPSKQNSNDQNDGDEDSDDDGDNDEQEKGALGHQQQQKGAPGNNTKKSKQTAVESKNVPTGKKDAAAQQQQQQQQQQQAKKKFVNKKKARRYADQDDEDRELAMLALGHTVKGEKTVADKEAKAKADRADKERARKQEKAGVKLVKEDWVDVLTALPVNVRTVIDSLVTAGMMKEGEIDSYEIKSLASFPEDQALTILELFRDGNNLRKVGNKSGFLAGIMRRFSKEGGSAGAMKAPKTTAATANDGSSSSSTTAAASEVEDGVEKLTVSDAIATVTADPTTATTAGAGDGGGGDSAMSRRDRKKKEQQEIQAILEEEGVLDEEEGKQADEIEKITGRPNTEDGLLYALPVCGPYASLSNFKYRVKLTPGTQKKGKAAKQAIELFTHSRECPPAEKALIKGLTDPEMVAILIADVKLSVPGLFVMQRQKKGKGKR